MGRGGMSSKINAASVAAAGGVQTCVASGFDVENVRRVFSGQDVGTLFPASQRPNKKQRWLKFATEIKGRLTIKRSVLETLVIGLEESRITGSDIVKVDGYFNANDVVSLVCVPGRNWCHSHSRYPFGASLRAILRM